MLMAGIVVNGAGAFAQHRDADYSLVKTINYAYKGGPFSAESKLFLAGDSDSVYAVETRVGDRNNNNIVSRDTVNVVNYTSTGAKPFFRIRDFNNDGIEDLIVLYNVYENFEGIEGYVEGYFSLLFEAETDSTLAVKDPIKEWNFE